MKVFAVNSSPRPEGQSKTFLMLEHLVKGMREAGAEVDIVDLRRKKINYCIGCYTCWTKTPGKCVHKDDMSGELFEKWVSSDMAVYAMPLYHYTVNAAMKTFIERTLPVAEPFLVEKAGNTAHPLRFERPPDAAVLSVCGFPEIMHFNELSAWAKRLFGDRLKAEIYRPGVELLPNAGVKRKEILQATERAGSELVSTGSVSDDTMRSVTQDIVDVDLFRELGNIMWQTCIDEGVTPKEFSEKKLIPRPDSLETFLAIMSIVFNPEAANEADAVLQFDFSGELDGSCQMRVSGGELEASVGTPHEATLVISSPFDVWMDIMSGKVDPQQMFMEQKCKADGDYQLLVKLNEWFAR